MVRCASIMDFKYLLLSLAAVSYFILVMLSLYNTRIAYLEWLAMVLPYLWVINIALALGMGLFWVRSGYINPLLPSLVLLLVLSFYLTSRMFTPSLISEHTQGGDQRLTLAFFNKLYSNTNYAEINKHVSEVNPDILGLAELEEADIPNIPTLKDFPHNLEKPIRGSFNLAIYSQFPIELDPKAPDLPYVLPVILKTPRSRYHLFVIHPQPPINQEWMRGRNSELEELAVYIKSLEDKQVILMGDFNLTPWSKTYLDLNKSLTGLKNSHTGSGLNFTWHNGLVRTQVDYIFVPLQAKVESYKNIGVKGSDHNLISTEISL
jgi:endonuclease/exonuclease/phosphatase (EEP) superfamily protein YafD